MRFFLLAAPALLLCSCATVVRGTDDTARFESTPSGADVTAESISKDKMGPYNCVTPCELELKRKRTWRVDFALEGYKPASALLKPELSGGGLAAGAGNALIGGLVGVGIDAGTGANLDLRPNPMVAELEPLNSPEPSRVLDAEPISDETPAPEEAPASEEMPEGGEAPMEAPPIASEAPLDPEQGASVAPEAPAVEPIEETAVEVGADDADSAPAEVDAPMNDASTDETDLHIYKPGEPAPNDEVADDLNRRQLEKAQSDLD
ncbi:MAG: hypothetical protein R3C55_10845 [Parvularculaceae bacterium]